MNRSWRMLGLMATCYLYGFRVVVAADIFPGEWNRSPYPLAGEGTNVLVAFNLPTFMYASNASLTKLPANVVQSEAYSNSPEKGVITFVNFCFTNHYDDMRFLGKLISGDHAYVACEVITNALEPTNIVEFALFLIRSNDVFYATSDASSNSIFTSAVYSRFGGGETNSAPFMLDRMECIHGEVSFTNDLTVWGRFGDAFYRRADRILTNSPHLARLVALAAPDNITNFVMNAFYTNAFPEVANLLGATPEAFVPLMKQLQMPEKIMVFREMQEESRIVTLFSSVDRLSVEGLENVIMDTLMFWQTNGTWFMVPHLYSSPVYETNEVDEGAEAMNNEANRFMESRTLEDIVRVSVLKRPPRVGFPFPGRTTADVSTSLTIPVTLSWPATNEVRVRVFVTGGTASNGVDYVFTNETVVIPQGEKFGECTVQITPFGGVADEKYADFAVEAVNGSSIVGDDRRFTLIIKHFTSSPSVSFVTRQTDAWTSNGVAKLPLALSWATTNRVEVMITPVAGDATNGVDFCLVETNAIVFLPGTTRVDYQVQLLERSASEAATKIEAFMITSASNADVGDVFLHGLSISQLNTNISVGFKYNSMAGAEGSNILAAPIEILLSRPSDITNSVGYTVAETGVVTNAYSLWPNRIEFAPGVTNSFLYLNILNSTYVEKTNNIELTLRDPSSGLRLLPGHTNMVIRILGNN